MRILLVILSLALTSVAFAAASLDPQAEKKAAEKTYPLRGVILALDAKNSALRVKHEKIPGFMGAMTMHFRIDPAELKSLAVGQTINATLYRDKNDDLWLREVQPESAPTK